MDCQKCQLAEALITIGRDDEIPCPRCKDSMAWLTNGTYEEVVWCQQCGTILHRQNRDGKGWGISIPRDARCAISPEDAAKSLRKYLEPEIRALVGIESSDCGTRLVVYTPKQLGEADRNRIGGAWRGYPVMFRRMKMPRPT